MKRILALLPLAASLLFAQQTPNLKLNIPPTGTANWGPSINYNFTTLDSVIGGLQSAYQGAWVSTTIYAKGQIVTFGTSAYMSLADGNINQEPDTSPTKWGLLSSSGTFVPAPGTLGNAPVSNGSGEYVSTPVVLGSAVGAASGVAGLDASSKVPLAQMYPCAASGTGHSAGIVPDPGATAGTTRYLREDCTWQVVSGSGGSPVGQQYRLAAYVGSGSGASTALGQLNFSTDTTSSDILGLRNLSLTGATTLVATDPAYAMNMTTTYTQNSAGVQDFVRSANFEGPGGFSYGGSTGLGNGVTGALWTNSAYTFWNANFYRRGITQWLNGTTSKYGIGDFAFIYGYPKCAGGLEGTSDEGCTAISLRYGEIISAFSGTALAGSATGGTTLPHAVGATIDGGYWVDQKTASITGHFTGPEVPTGNYFSEPIDATVTPSVAYGNLACSGGLHSLANQTVPESVNCQVSGILGSTGAFTVGSTVTISGGWTEQTKITAAGAASGGVQTVSFLHRKPNIVGWMSGTYILRTTINDGSHLQVVTTAGTSGSTAPTWNHAGGSTTDGSVVWHDQGTAAAIGQYAMLWQGGPQGNVQCHDFLQTVSGLPQCEIVFGAPDSTHLAAGINKGGVLSPPQAGIFATQTLTALTVSGTTVTATAVGGGVNGFGGLASVIIAGCSDATINGTGTNVTLNPDNTISWTYPGGGTGCASATMALPPSYSSFHAYPYAEQIASFDGTGNSTLEPNNVAWTSGDPIVQPHPPTWSGAGIWLTSGIFNPTGGTASVGLLLDGQGAGISNGYNFIKTRNNNPETIYAGAGGVLAPPVMVNLYGPNGGVLAGLEPLPGYPAIALGCRISGCNNLPVLVFNISGLSNNGTITFAPQTGSWTFGPNITVPSFTVTGSATMGSATINNLTAGTGNAIFTHGLSITQTDGLAHYLTISNGTGAINYFGLCTRFGATFSDMCFGASNDAGLSVYSATGNIWAGAYNGSTQATFNGIQSSIGAPNFVVAPIYSGTAGANTATYGLQAVTALGSTVVGPSRTILSLGTLGGSNFVTIPCPTSLQYGYPTGTTYVLWKEGSSGTTGINLGTCAVGSSVVDSGTLTTVVALPTISSTSPIYAARIVDTELGNSTSPVCPNGPGNALTTTGCIGGGGGMVYPGAGVPVSSGTAWGTSLAAPASALVGLTDTQTLTNKTIDGVSPAMMAFVDATSSIQTQINGKASLSAGFNSFTGAMGVGGSLTAAVGLFVSGSNVAAATSEGVLDEITGSSTTRLISWGTSSAPGDVDLIGESPDLSHTDNYLQCSHLTGCTFNDPISFVGTVHVATATASTPACYDAGKNLISCATTPQISAVTGSIGGSALAAGACATGTATIAGGTIGHTVQVSSTDGSLPDPLMTPPYAVVTSSTVITVQECAIGPVTPAAKTYNVTTY